MADSKSIVVAWIAKRALLATAIAALTVAIGFVATIRQTLALDVGCEIPLRFRASPSSAWGEPPGGISSGAIHPNSGPTFRYVWFVGLDRMVSVERANCER